MKTVNISKCAELVLKIRHSTSSNISWALFLSRRYTLGLVCRFSSLGRINDDKDNQYDLNKLVITWSSFNAVVLGNKSSTQQLLDWGRRGRHVPRAAWHKKRPVGENGTGQIMSITVDRAAILARLWQVHITSHNLMHMGKLLRLTYLERFLNNSRKSNSVQSNHSDQSQQEKQRDKHRSNYMWLAQSVTKCFDS